MTSLATIECTLPTGRRQSTPPARQPRVAVGPGRVPRVSRLLALALCLDQRPHGHARRLRHPGPLGTRVAGAGESASPSAPARPGHPGDRVVPTADRAWPRRDPLASVASSGGATRLAAPAASLARAPQFHRAGNRPAAGRGVGRLGWPEETINGYLRSQMWNPEVNRKEALTSGYVFGGGSDQGPTPTPRGKWQPGS
jgi:hypothetical protein